MAKKYPIYITYLLIVFTYILAFFNQNAACIYANEDGLIETAGALFFLLTSICFFASYYYSYDLERTGWLKFHRNIFYLFLGILFFICFGEEISWGQRLFNWEIPDWFNRMNAQGELNIHNIWVFHAKNPDGSQKSFIEKMLNMQRLFSVFWLFYCVIVPLINKFSLKCNTFFKKITLPIAPLWISGLFITNFVTFRLFYIFHTSTGQNIIGCVNELKESNYAIVFSVFALWKLSKMFKYKMSI